MYFVILNNNSIVEQHIQLNVIQTNQMDTFILASIILNFLLVDETGTFIMDELFLI